MQRFEKTGCTTCHSGPAFNGVTAFPAALGVFRKFPTFTDSAYVKKYGLVADEGRYEATKRPEDRHMWRVPTLRNLGETAPYFHNGAVKTLDEAVRVMAKTQLNKDLGADEVHDIVAFLGALDGTFPKQAMPRLPPTPGNLLD